MTDTRCVLTIDTGRFMGGASRGRDGKVRMYYKHFPDVGGRGYPYLQLRHWLTETKNTLGGIDAVYWEELSFIGKGVQNARLKFGFEAIITSWCEHHRIPYKGFAPVTIKKFITGSGKSDKEDIIVAVNALGFDIDDDNVADATALLMMALDRMDMGVILPTPEPETEWNF